MRAIIRFSISNEPNSALRNNLANILAGFKVYKTADKTATYEVDYISQADLAAMMEKFFKSVHNHQGTGILDHFWMYTDHKDDQTDDQIASVSVD